VEEKDAPCKTPTIIEGVEITCKNSPKMGKGWQGSKKNLSMKQQKIPDTMNKVSFYCYGNMGFAGCFLELIQCLV
jgi:hypothetical protein